MMFRNATMEDIPALVELNALETFDDLSVWNELSQEERWVEGLWWVDHELLTWYLQIIQHTGGNILVAIEDDKIVGELDYCQSYDYTSTFEGNRLHIIWLLSHPSHRREGIAKKMVSYLQSTSSLPIWVEAEDHRTEGFYSSIGDVIHNISNWELELDQISNLMLDHRIPYQIYDISDLHEIVESHQLLVGRYYAPSYDLLQLDRSQPVEDYMWGNTDRAEVFYYELERTSVYAIITQYPRIWVNKEYKKDELEKILSSIFLSIFELGFDKVFLQIYNDSGLSDFLRLLNFNCTISADPVFLLH